MISGPGGVTGSEIILRILFSSISSDYIEGKYLEIRREGAMKKFSIHFKNSGCILKVLRILKRHAEFLTCSKNFWNVSKISDAYPEFVTHSKNF